MSRFERWSIWLTSAATAFTGVGYFMFRYLVRTDDPFAVVNHPLEPAFLKAHLLVSPLLLYAVGLITVRHVWRHFRSGARRARLSGSFTALAVVPMVATGYLLPVLTGAGWLRAMAIAHVAFGALYVAGLIVHQWVLRRRVPGPAADSRAAGSRASRRSRPSARPRETEKSPSPIISR
ncbi:MAG: hypothetical protein ACRELC_07060 [Gemmatimonadota bacterium]